MKHKIFTTIVILAICCCIYAEKKTYEPITFIQIKNIVQHQGTNADTLGTLIENFSTHYTQMHQEFKTQTQPTPKNSRLNISFDFRTEEYFSGYEDITTRQEDETQAFYIDSETQSILFPAPDLFRAFVKHQDSESFSLTVQNEPILYRVDRRESSFETMIENYAVISLDHTTFDMEELTTETGFNRIFFRTQFITLKADFPGRISHKDGILNIAFTPTQRFNIAEEYWELVAELNEKLMERGVPANWLVDNINSPHFTVYHSVERHFSSMAEHQVSRGERDQDWYMRHFGVDAKVQRGPAFRDAHIDALRAAEQRTGIHYELMLAIMAIESDYANPRWKGSFYTFPTLVSQYVLLPRRQRFATNELKALYDFTKKTNKDTYHFIGSFAGAAGWGQFIPSSMSAYFIDANDDFTDVDIYGIDDTIHSIGNYLNKHGLNRSNINNYQSRYNAVLAYNRSDAYVKAVLYIYDKLHEQRERK